ncbi:MAG: hypothetical protein LBI76_06430 [Comamonas sp.]|nr:hypothetical protein [Comamonas sp.]
MVLRISGLAPRGICKLDIHQDAHLQRHLDFVSRYMKLNVSMLRQDAVDAWLRAESLF